MLMAAALLLTVDLSAGTKLVYKWGMRGKDVVSDSLDAETGITRRLALKGYLCFDYDESTGTMSGCELVKCWMDKGTKTLKYSTEKFLQGEHTISQKTTDKGTVFEITGLGENYSGLIKNGIKLPDKSVVLFPPIFKGSAAWKNVGLETGKSSTGEGKLTLKYDSKRTALYAAATADSGDSVNQGTADNSVYEALFIPKPATLEKDEEWRSVYWGEVSAQATGLFEWLAVGTEEEYYAFPAKIGNKGEYLGINDSGEVVWMGVQSRDAYLLDRANHIGTQKASTIADFREAVEAIIGGPLDPEIITNITNQIDLEKLLDRLSEFLDTHNDTWLSEHIDSSTIIDGMDASDIEELLKKLQSSSGWDVGGSYDDAEIKAILEALKAYLAAGGTGFDESITNYIDPTTIINKMDSTDIAKLKTLLAYTKDDIGLGNVENIKNNYTATAAPAVTDDTSKGYSAGSAWLDTTNKKAYYCLNATAGAAVWLNLIDVTVAASQITGLEDAVNNTSKLKLITVTKAVNLDTLSGLTLTDGDTVNLSNMKDAVKAILDYIHNDMGVNPEIYDKNKL